ncbi:MAG: succinate dehydrogenase, hydrophobic membrane anchor protein [Gammaproteobacteria bacterium]|nr:succinate dehydrogenase, hydrophobic membrane anchor protein [Gammaproteobacteria bacterium]MCZ6585489.1 succinate dehydrogenase, hydrophobic membrane anchor protein [Gammaproteobacteria bacterium]
MRLVTPLNRVLGLGSAKDGLEHWWAQRLSAVALTLLGLWLVFAFLGLPDLRYGTVAAWLQAPLTSILMILTLLTLGYHSQLGVQAVIEDYVHAAGLKLSALVLTTFVHISIVVASVFAVLKIALGAAA